MSIDSMLRDNWKVILLLLCISFIVTFFNSAFSILYGDYTPWPDINIYYTIGKGIYFDKIPYKDLFDHKGPIIFFIYYIAYFLSPDSFQGLYFIESLFVFISLIYVYRISHLFISKNLSVLSSIIFATLLATINENGGTAEEFILTFILISLYYFIKYYRTTEVKHNPKIMLVHGVMFTLCLFLKLNLVIFWIIPIISILGFLLHKKDYGNFIFNLLYLIVAVVSTSLIILSYFYFHNAIDDFWKAYIVINSRYGEVVINNVYYSCRFLYKNPVISFFIFLSLISFFSFTPQNKRFFSFSLLLTCFTQYFLLTISRYTIDYYFIIYLTFVPLGIVFFLFKVHPFFKKSNLLNYSFYSIISIICLFTIVTCKKFQHNTYEDLVNRTPKKEYRLNKISKYIEDSGNKPFFSLGIDFGLNLFTLNKQVPTVKYFFGPNLRPDTLFPELYDAQERYIRNKEVNFVIMNYYFHYKDRFRDVLESSGYKEVLKDSAAVEYTLYAIE